MKLSLPKGKFDFSTDKIVRMESRSNYTYIYFTDRKPILTPKVLKSFEKVLRPCGFLRTHQSHLVNRKFITNISKGLVGASLVMEDDSHVQISKRKKKEVFAMLNDTQVSLTPVLNHI